jgi:hypothetical protein
MKENIHEKKSQNVKTIQNQLNFSSKNWFKFFK